ncbi:hypothetical protein VNO78_24019 [Psophocarpus tetragonolobus]|uniref:Uncharacterized protein n=1 Tax=Psophocarpus tetragonolobus TaxID=3891 RepID=A0AAN9S7S2_PSOTE
MMKICFANAAENSGALISGWIDELAWIAVGCVESKSIARDTHLEHAQQEITPSSGSCWKINQLQVIFILYKVNRLKYEFRPWIAYWKMGFKEVCVAAEVRARWL